MCDYLRDMNQTSGASTLPLKKKPERRLPRAHSPRPIQSHPARVRKPSSKRLSNSWPGDRYLRKRHGPLMALPRAQASPRFSLAPPSASLRKNSSIPTSSSTDNSNPPGSRHQLRAIPHSRPGRPQETCPSPRHSPVVKELPFPKGREHHHRP
jgi:hypothetical protein